MALKLSNTERFYWPVSVNLPVDGGRFEKQEFEALFPRMKVSEVEALVGKVYTGEIKSPRQAVRSIVHGWRGVVDDGQDVQFNDANVDALLDIPGVANAVFEAFREAMSGAARAKN